MIKASPRKISLSEPPPPLREFYARAVNACLAKGWPTENLRIAFLFWRFDGTQWYAVKRQSQPKIELVFPTSDAALMATGKTQTRIVLTSFSWRSSGVEGL